MECRAISIPTAFHSAPAVADQTEWLNLFVVCLEQIQTKTVARSFCHPPGWPCMGGTVHGCRWRQFIESCWESSVLWLQPFWMDSRGWYFCDGLVVTLGARNGTRPHRSPHPFACISLASVSRARRPVQLLLPEQATIIPFSNSRKCHLWEWRHLREWLMRSHSPLPG